MGKKADALKNQLEERNDVVRSCMTLIGAVARMCGVSVTDTVITGNNLDHYVREFSQALQPPPGDDQDEGDELSDGAAQALARVRELEVSYGSDLETAIATYRAETSTARDELAKARLVINRVAGAMQIDRWDADGTELIERAQRWNTFQVMLRRRTQALAASGRFEVAAELRSQLALLMSKPEHEAWVRSLPDGAASDAVVQAFERGAQYPATMADLDADIIRYGLVAMQSMVTQRLARGENLIGDPDAHGLVDSISEQHLSDRAALLRRMFECIVGYPTVTREFTRLMNIIVLPMLAGFLPKEEPAAGDAEQPGTV